MIPWNGKTYWKISFDEKKVQVLKNRKKAMEIGTNRSSFREHLETVLLRMGIK